MTSPTASDSPGTGVVVWGNCQAEPLARLLAGPLGTTGLHVVDVPPVFLAEEAEVEHLHEVLASAAVLVTQPVREEYRVPGCGWQHLAGLLPGDGRVVTVPVVFHTGLFPFQVNAHGADGARVDAPTTIYHDLRAVAAWQRGMTVDEAVHWWPSAGAEAARITAERSLDELRRREAGLDVAASDLVHRADGLYTVDHPANVVLGELARRILSVLGVDAAVEVPEREFLGERRAPVDPGVVRAFDWPADRPPDWVVNGVRVPLADIVSEHLEFYAAHPDVAQDCLTRQGEQMQLLELLVG